MSEKTRVGLLFGGRSCEHEVSVTSARSVLAAIDPERYEVSLIGITKQGKWISLQEMSSIPLGGQVSEVHGIELVFNYSAQEGAHHDSSERQILAPKDLDVIFPLLHGPYGEDGTIQGLLELANVAYVGSGVVGSAVGMDKEMSRKVFATAGLPQVDYVVVHRQRWRVSVDDILNELTQRLKFPLFVKPVSLGSSVGVSKAVNVSELRAAIDHAAKFDAKVMIEVAVLNCHEVECAVLGNESPKASIVGEIIPSNEFYDYEAKYEGAGSETRIPAAISERSVVEVQRLSVAAFRAVGAEGLGRVDFFVGHEDDRIYLNEINTMPGFTPISMYPKLWAESGIPYSDLIDRLIELAFERHEEKKNTQTVL